MTTYRSLLGAAALGIGVAAFGFGTTQEASAALIGNERGYYEHTLDFGIFSTPFPTNNLFSGFVGLNLSGGTLEVGVVNESPDSNDPNKPNIVSVFFENGWGNFVSSLAPESVTNIGSVSMVSPASLPGTGEFEQGAGATPSWGTPSYYSVTAAGTGNDRIVNSIGPDDAWITTWNLQDGASLAALKTAMIAGPARIGAFVQNCNEAGASCQAMTVPVPAALPLLLTALGALGIIGRKKMKATATA